MNLQPIKLIPGMVLKPNNTRVIYNLILDYYSARTYFQDHYYKPQDWLLVGDFLPSYNIYTDEFVE